MYTRDIMIKPSKALKAYIEGFESRESACKKLEVAPETLSRYLKEEQSCATAFIESVKRVVGWDFEKAFDIEEDR